MAAAEEDFLTCQVCKHRSTTDPQIMPCYHIACFECLVNEDETFECPACLFESDVELLPEVQSKATEFLSSVKRRMSKTTSVKCQSCLQSGKKAEFKCMESGCELALCNSCTNIHKNVPATKKHDIIPIHERANPNIRSQYARKVYCQTHKDQTMDFYCVHCATLVCRDCTQVGEHKPWKGHDVQKAEEVVPECKRSVERLLKDTNAAATRVNQQLQNLDKELKATNEGYMKAEQEITEHYRKLIGKLMEEEQQMRRKVCKIKEERKDELHCKIAETNSKLKREYIAGIKFCRNVLDQDSSTDFLLLKEQMEERLQKLALEPIDHKTVSCQLPSLSLTSVNETAAVSTVRIHVKGPAVENQPCSVTVTTYTVDLIGRDDPQLEVISQNGVKAWLPMTVQLNTDPLTLGDGSMVTRTWGAVWRPQSSGNHSLSVFKRGKKQPGSLTVYVDVG